MKLLNKIVNFFSHTAQQTNAYDNNKMAVTSPLMRKTCRQLAGEGIVLLKNDGVLPLDLQSEVAVFGRTQYNYFCIGYGSGGDVRAPYKTSLADGLKACKDIHVNKQVDEVYAKWCKNNVPDEGFWGHWPFCFKEMPLDSDLVKSARNTSDIALVVIGRSAGEDREQKLEKGSFYLTDSECDMLDKVCCEFEKVVLILDVGNVIDFEKINEYGDKISAIVLAWHGGMESGNALCDVLCGKVSPSGRLVDTIAKKYENYPSAQDFGGVEYNEYSEDIFVGYRFFETFAKDEVLYPFGYGLSYTQFNLSSSVEKVGDKARVKVLVKNVGDRDAKTVVQVYVKGAKGKLIKPQRELKAFEKTTLLQSGQSQEILLDIDEYTLSSYDDEGLSGHKACWVLEGGEYEFYVGENVRDAVLAGSVHFDEKVTRVCHTACSLQKPFAVLKNYAKDGDTFKWEYRQAHSERGYLKKRILDNMPKEIMHKPHFNPHFDDVKNGVVSIEDFVATLTDRELEVLCHGDLRMNSKHGAKGNAGAFGGISKSLQKKGIACAITTDGPSGIRLAQKASLLPCGSCIASSWNTSLAQRVYECIGDEMLEKGSDVLLGPGMNIHRNPLCGRNFEYYSEDPFLSGKMASSAVSGVQSRGVASCIKHFACNNQEKHRFVNDSRVSERALREIYLKGFEIAIKESKPLVLMMSYNKLNGVYTYHNYDLATTILREEWGYGGLVITDWWTMPAKNPDFPLVNDNAYRVRAGVDVLMPGGSRVLGRYDHSTYWSLKFGGLKRAELQRTACRVLELLVKLDK